MHSGQHELIHKEQSGKKTETPVQCLRNQFFWADPTQPITEKNPKVRILTNIHNTDASKETTITLRELAEQGKLVYLNEGLNFSLMSKSPYHLPLDNIYVKMLSSSTMTFSRINLMKANSNNIKEYVSNIKEYISDNVDIENNVINKNAIFAIKLFLYSTQSVFDLLNSNAEIKEEFKNIISNISKLEVDLDSIQNVIQLAIDESKKFSSIQPVCSTSENIQLFKRLVTAVYSPDNRLSLIHKAISIVLTKTLSAQYDKFRQDFEEVYKVLDNDPCADPLLTHLRNTFMALNIKDAIERYSLPIYVFVGTNHIKDKSTELGRVRGIQTILREDFGYLSELIDVNQNEFNISEILESIKPEEKIQKSYNHELHKAQDVTPISQCRIS